MHFFPKPEKINSLPYLEQGSIVAATWKRANHKDAARCPDFMGKVVTPTGSAHPVLQSLTQKGVAHRAESFGGLALIGGMQA